MPKGRMAFSRDVGGRPKSAMRLVPWAVNNTDPASVILTSKRPKALPFLRKAFSEAQISCFQDS